MKYSYIIIDNDEKSANELRSILKEFPNYYCRGVANDERSGMDLILKEVPDLVFLEVESPGMLGNITHFNLVHELKNYLVQLPKIIVVTKSIEYTLQAIKNDVLDYILKPVNSFEIRKAFMRHEKKYGKNPETLCIKSYGDYRFIELDEIQYLKADNNTTDIFMKNGEKVSAIKTLKCFEESLPHGFVRIHNSYIVNTGCISRIHFGKSRFTMKASEDFIPFSRNYKSNVEAIKEAMKHKNVLEF
ncbi:LytTR family DNA-binding domain-containing protein [Leptobacterium sp. I13]|uniref:LytR/AlgR family response regulator transcription factor n=1 Tax=Leptobacterium meishanense TaxID=3128904 RepID=UPI0030EF04FA